MAKVGSLNVIEKLQNNEDEHVKMQAIYYLKTQNNILKLVLVMVRIQL